MTTSSIDTDGVDAGFIETGVLTRDELDRRLAEIEGVVLDIDGCLVLSTLPGGHGGAPLPGAREVIDTVRATGRSLVVFTNASSQVPHAVAASLASMGFDLTEQDVLTPSVVAAEVIRQRFGDGPVLAYGGPGLLDVLTDAGITLVDHARPEDAVAVIVGWDPEFDRDKIQSAAEAIWNGAPLLVTSDARQFASPGRPTAGVGGFIASGLRYITGCDYEVVGKPSRAAMTIAARRLGARPDRVLVAGDDLTLEVSMARRAGGVGVLVTTGTHKRDDVASLDEADAPHLVVDRLEQLAERIAEADRRSGRVVVR